MIVPTVRSWRLLPLAGALFATTVFSQQPPPPQTPTGTGPTPEAPAGTGPTAQPTTAGPGELQRVVVTGTLIPTAESETAFPVTTYTEETLKNFGGTTPVEALRSIPSFFGQAADENNSNGGTGTATIDLRGLGDVYTLVLVDNRRVISPIVTGSTGASGLSNLQLIPQNFIEKIDVLKDGATTRYGSDAVAGVVNIGLRHSLPQGTYGELDFLYGNTTNKDAGVVNFTALGGFSDDKVTVIGGYDYYHRNALYSRDRDLSSNANAVRFGGVDKRSPTYPGVADFATGPNVGLNALNNPGAVPTSAADYHPQFSQPQDGFNFLAFTPSIPKYLRNSYYASIDAKIFDKYLEFFGDFLHTSSRFYSALAPSPYPTFGIDPASSAAVVANTPYNPDPALIDAARYRSIILGDRTTTFDETENYFQAGFRGEIPSFDEKIYSPISWEVGFVREESREEEFDGGDFRKSVFTNEVANGTIDPFIGIDAPQTGTVIGNDGLPHTYNNIAGLSAAAVGEVSNYTTIQQLIDLTLRSTFFPDLPQNGFTLAVGAEYRWLNQDNQFSPVTATNDTAGFEASTSWKAQSEVAAIYGEILLPIVSPEMKVPLIYSLDVDAALRYERYLNGGADQTPGANLRYIINGFHSTDPKIAVRYQPIQDLTVRGSYSTAFRAPSLSQQFAGSSLSATELFNPLIGQNQQLDFGAIQGSNPNLRPETARIWTLGGVYTPHFVPGTLTLSCDFYYIHQSNLIAANDPGFILNQFFTNGSFANLIVLEPGGRVFSVNATAFNVASRDVSGLDLNLIYKTPTFNWGSLTLTTAWNYTLKYKLNPGQGQPTINFLGHFVDPQSGAAFAPGSIPYWKGFVDLAYDFQNFELGAKVNYTGAVYDDTTQTNNGEIRHVADQTTLDIRASYTFKKPVPVEPNNVTSYSKEGKGGKQVVPPPAVVTKPSLLAYLLGGTTIRVGMNNVFDQAPPFAAGAFNDNYDTSLYTNRGRFYYVNLQKQF
jgi:iron complex outermembrane recepter protein